MIDIGDINFRIGTDGKEGGLVFFHTLAIWVLNERLCKDYFKNICILLLIHVYVTV